MNQQEKWVVQKLRQRSRKYVRDLPDKLRAWHENAPHDADLTHELLMLQIHLQRTAAVLLIGRRLWYKV